MGRPTANPGPRFLQEPALRLLLFGGKGGVGKTTCAAATAVRMAAREPARRIVLVSTDPAHSLLDSLGGWQPPDNLEVLELQAGERMEAFRTEHRDQLREIARRGTFLDDEDIARFLELSLPGMDELFAFLEISRWVGERPASDRIIVDTAPTGHTLRLLAMPELLRRWIEALDSLLAKHRYMTSVFRRKRVADELDAFLDDLDESIDRLQAMLQDPRRCQFVPAMIAEELSVRETADLLAELARLAIPAGEVLVNKLVPPSSCEVCAEERGRQLQALAGLPSQYAGHTLWGLPWVPEGRRSAVDLAALWDHATPIGAEPAGAGVGGELPIRVENPAPPPLGARLLVFAGKGGVGKTTLACATAVRLAREGRKVLLFSTDPAHSLADCLDVPLGGAPTAITEGLTAFEIDAQAELVGLKQEYRRELDEFLAAVLGRLDITFDRKVMERILDLAPPGIDEIMALTRALDLLGDRRNDLLILDAAPTGHLIRLLELPQIIEQWLKAFFELFLKYRDVFRVPRLTERLVKMSKSLRAFRALLGEPDRAALYAVTILTRMALEETRDLRAACLAMRLSQPVVFFNAITPPSACPLCSQRVEEEEQIAATFRAELVGAHPVWVYRQQEPRGLARLERLGAALYRRT